MADVAVRDRQSGRPFVQRDLGDTYFAPSQAAHLFTFDGAAWIPNYRHQAFTVLPSAVRAADTNSADFTHYGAYALALIINITVITGTGVIVRFQSKDPISGSYLSNGNAPSAHTTASTFGHIIGFGGLSTGGGVGSAVQQVLWPTFRVFMDHQDSNNLTYSVAGYLLY
jgi:hypothetical protein